MMPEIFMDLQGMMEGVVTVLRKTEFLKFHLDQEILTQMLLSYITFLILEVTMM